jgi:integrase
VEVLSAGPQEFGWQYLFAAQHRSRDPKTGNVGRYHVNPGLLARAVVAAAHRVGLNRRAGCHTLQHSFATPVARRGPAGVPSPLDLLGDVSAAELQAALEATRRLTSA